MITKDDDHAWREQLTTIIIKQEDEKEPKALLQEPSVPPLPDVGSKISLSSGRYPEEGDKEFIEEKEEEEFVVDGVSYDYTVITTQEESIEGEGKEPTDRLYSFVEIDVTPTEDGEG
jgi:hypothetical protein